MERSKIFITVPLTLAVVLFSPFSSMAASYTLLLGGESDTENQWYLYTGIIAEKPIQQDIAIMGKVWFDYLIYRFEKDSDRIKAEAPAIQSALGVKFLGQDWSTTMWAGWEHRYTKIRPFREDVEMRGTTDSLILQTEIDKWIKTMNLNLIVSYSTENSYMWSRGRLKQELSSSYHLGRNHPLRVGVEIIGQGNKDYSAFQLGPLLEVYSFSDKISFLIHGGYKNSSSIRNSAYGGIELSLSF